MMKLKTLFAALAILLAPLTGIASADDRATVQTFYDFLSNPTSEEHAGKLKSVLSPDWGSIGDYSGYVKPGEKFLAQIGGFGKLIPDMNWAVEEMIVAGDRVIVRGRASGTPAGPLFGVDGKGKSFEIMSIDIHTVKDGLIVETFHVEDWAGALQQLSGK